MKNSKPTFCLPKNLMVRPFLLVCILILFQLVFLSSVAQIPQEPVTVQTPNAASFGLFGEVPVSHFTGLPSIELPLYTFVDKKLAVPINLSYHASGFRPDFHPGWVGMGWNLAAGGVITRTVHDMPDDYHNPNYGAPGTNAGFYFNYSVLNNSSWDQPTYMKSIAQDDDMFKDTEPDEFSFNFPGFSGKFYLDHNRNWKVKCNQPVKVSFNNQFLDVPFTAPAGTRMQDYGNFKSFAGFTLTDDKGNQYIFGSQTNAIEYSMGFFTQHMDEWIAEAWYLIKIISADGYDINFAYERGNYINQMYISLYNNIQTKTVNSGGFLEPECITKEYRSIAASYSGKLLSPVYLRSISAANSKIEFKSSTSNELRYNQNTYSFQYSQWLNSSGTTSFLPFLSDLGSDYPACLDKLQWRKLDTIFITEKMNTRAFIFTYNNALNERLALLSVKEVGNGSYAKPPYRFFYDGIGSLPPYLSNKTDHWGFYNGTYADISNIETYYSTYYSYREPNPTYLNAGILNKIVYPTGGITEFTYEPHQYSRRLQVSRSSGIDPSFNTNTIAGGLRIKKIVSYDSITPAVKTTKEYFYVRNYTNQANVSSLLSSGVLGGQIKYYFDDYRSEAFNDNGVVYSKAIFSSQSVLPACNNSQGSHIGYSEVVEKRSDSGYTRYFFTNFENGHIDEAAPSLQITRTAYEPYTSLEEERGLLWKEEQYNNMDKLFKKRTITYAPLDKNNQYVRSMSARYFNVCDNTAVSCAEGIAYKIYTYSYLPVLETDSLYGIDGSAIPVSNRNTFRYDPVTRLLKETNSLKSKGDTLRTILNYPADYPSSSIYQGMVDKNILSPVIEESKFDVSDGIIPSMII